jgi:hypothetical protein
MGVCSAALRGNKADKYKEMKRLEEEKGRIAVMASRAGKTGCS